MDAVLRAPNRRALAVVGPGLLIALGFGLVAGRWPVAAVGAALIAALAVVMLRDLTIAIVVFTVASFAGVLSSGSASAAKGIGFLLVIAWMATLRGNAGGDSIRSLLQEHRGLAAFGIGLVAWSVISAAWAESPSTALVGATRYAQDLVLLPIVYAGVRRPAHIRWIAAAFVVGALGSMLYGLATGSTVDGSRLVGAIGDPNETATLLVATSVLAVALACASSSRRAAMLYSAGAVLAVFGAAATASRGGMVALAATALVAPLVAGRWRRQIACAAAVGAVLALGWFTLLAPASSRSHITNTQSPRTTLWQVAARAIAANPVGGVGNDNFSIAAKNFLVQPGATARADQIVIKQDVAHSIYLEVLADTGVVGLALFVGVVLVALRAAWMSVATLKRAERPAEEILARAVIVAVVAILAAGFFVSDQYSKQLFVLLGLAVGLLPAARVSTRRLGA